MSAWDDGIRWSVARTVAPTQLPLSVEYVRDQVLRVANGSVENSHIESLIHAATAAAEDATGRSLMPQTWQMTLTGFPAGRIRLLHPPLVAVDSFSYVDTGGATQSLAVSPPDYRVKPSSKWSLAELWPTENTQWPSTASVASAVTITYQAGYTGAAVLGASDAPIPGEILIGIELMVGELYKQRSLSVHAVHNTPSVITLRSLWKSVTEGLA